MSDSTDMAVAQRHLDSFLVENQELEILNARLSGFNLFDVLRVDKAEIRHSNVLAWLLSPDGSHGLGPIFLRRFLSRLLMDSGPDNLSLTPSQVELMNLADVEVLREWQHIDVLVRSPGNRWCLLIENKIKSKESKGQLTRYMARVREEMPDYEVIPVFLTLEGEDPSEAGQEAGFVPLSHVQVLELAEEIVKQHNSRIPLDAHTFLTHYLETLRRLTMQDQELIDLCKAIYRKHRVAIDLITEYGVESNVLENCLIEIQAQTKCEFATTSRGLAWFLPESMGELLPSQTLSAWNSLPRSVPIAFWFRHVKDRGALKLVMEVGPIADSTRRTALLTALQDQGLAVRDAGFREGAKFTRLVSHSLKVRLDDGGDPDFSDDEVRRTASTLWKKFDEPRQKVMMALKDFNWDQDAGNP